MLATLGITFGSETGNPTLKSNCLGAKAIAFGTKAIYFLLAQLVADVHKDRSQRHWKNLTVARKCKALFNFTRRACPSGIIGRSRAFHPGRFAISAAKSS